MCMPQNSSSSSNSSSVDSAPNAPFIIAHKALSLSLIAFVLFAVSGSLWWKQVYNSPHRVFESMLVNNLSTQSVTRSSVSTSDGTPVDKTEQVSFVPDIATRSIVVVNQKNPDGGNNKVVTESIGTLAADYNRYISINTAQKNATGKALDYSAVENIWGKSDGQQGQPQLFSQSLLSLVPFANLGATNRQKVLRAMTDKKAYDVQYDKVKPLRINGKSALVYPVKVNAEGYVGVLKIVAKATGLGDLPGLDPASYKGQPPIEISITVDKLSRQVIEVDYGSSQKETYSAYGLVTPIELPTKTVPTSELQKKVQEIK